ncbi:hypothetical protein Trydic_g22460 [Trypoxylus dichotomus]
MMGKPPKKIDNVAKLVVQALRELKDSNGSSINSIRNHIVQNYPHTPALITRLPLALRRGIVFGAIKKNRGLYKLDTVMTLVATHGRRRRRSRHGRRRRRRRRRRH